MDALSLAITELGNHMTDAGVAKQAWLGAGLGLGSGSGLGLGVGVGLGLRVGLHQEADRRLLAAAPQVGAREAERIVEAHLARVAG